jgi:aldehyde dehydrogenase (NAD+)
VLCHSSKYNEFLTCAQKCLKDFYGDDVQKSNDFCRIVSERHCIRLKGLLEGEPGRIVAGGKVDPSDRYVEPTIIADVKLDSKLMKEEIFGPLLPVMQFETIDDAISIMNAENLGKPLVLYIFSKDRQMIDKVTTAVTSGGVLVNDTLFHVVNPYMPFGGVGGSGMGGYHGEQLIIVQRLMTLLQQRQPRFQRFFF